MAAPAAGGLKMTNSVWTFPYSTRYYLTHPWKWFKQLWRNCRDVYRRARYGWTYSDVWNWDTWFLTIVPDMFKHLAHYSMAYPGEDPFNTPDEWQAWLLKVANLIEQSSEEWCDENNEYYEPFMNNFSDEEIRKKYFARQEELINICHSNIHEALTEIATHFYKIWD